MSRRRGLAWPSAVAGLALGACGGGNHSVSGGTPVSDPVRTASLTAIQQQQHTLAGQAPDVVNQALATFMKGRPEFEDAGVSDDGCAWGRFTDGRLAVIANNRPPDTTAAPRLAWPGRVTRAAGLPQSTTVQFYDTMGPIYPHIGQGLQDSLVARGYTSAQVQTHAGTVDELRQVSGGGIFYWFAHGGKGNERGTGTGSLVDHRTVFAIWTATKPTQALEQQYLADLNSNKLVYILALEDKDPKDGSDVDTWHYAITLDFVTAYMRFGPNSVVYVDACSSNNDNFRTACLTAGAGVYIGWTQPVFTKYSVATAQFFFDRMLGIDAVPPLDPSNPPPADWPTVQAAMPATLIPGTTVHYGHSPAVDPKTDHDADLVFTAGQGDLAVILPSITTVAADRANKRLTLTGKFGTKAGTAAENATATTDGSPVTVVTWGDTQVVTQLPDDCQSVQLAVDGRKSNIVPVPAGHAQIDPASATVVLAGGTKLFTASTDATVPAGAALAYHWSIPGQLGLLSDAGGHAGAAFDSTDNQALYTAGTASVGTENVTVEVFVVSGNQRQSVGVATAPVQVTAQVALNPSPSSIASGGTAALVASVSPTPTAGALEYHWTSTTTAGDLSPAAGRADFTNGSNKASYTAQASAVGSDTITVAVTQVNGAVRTLIGTATATVQVRSQTQTATARLLYKGWHPNPVHPANWDYEILAAFVWKVVPGATAYRMRLIQQAGPDWDLGKLGSEQLVTPPGVGTGYHFYTGDQLNAGGHQHLGLQFPPDELYYPFYSNPYGDSPVQADVSALEAQYQELLNAQWEITAIVP